MEQSSHQSSLRANLGFKGNKQQKDPTPSFKNSSFLLSHVLEARALFCCELCRIKQLRPLAGWLFQGCQMFCLGHVRSVLLEFRLSLLSGCPLQSPLELQWVFLYLPSTSFSQGSNRDWEHIGKGLVSPQPVCINNLQRESWTDEQNTCAAFSGSGCKPVCKHTLLKRASQHILGVKPPRITDCPQLPQHGSFSFQTNCGVL